MKSIRLVRTYQGRLEDVTTPDPLLRGLRRADDFIRLGVVAAYHCLHSSNTDSSAIPAEKSGLVMGTGYGTMQTNFDVLDSIVSGEQTSPTLFSHSVFNAAAGYMATLCNLRGCALTVTDFSLPFAKALREASLALASGWLDRCLVLQVETYSRLLDDARCSPPRPAEHWPPGVVCWLLESGEVCDKAQYFLSVIDVMDEPVAALQYLHPQITVRVNDHQVSCDHPLGGPGELTSIIEAAQAGTMRCILTENGCSAQLAVTKK